LIDSVLGFFVGRHEARGAFWWCAPRRIASFDA